MKKILLLIAALGLSISSQAATMTNAQAVKLVIPYQTTCSSMTISTTATDVSGNTTSITTTAGISNIAVLNWDTNNIVYCDEMSTVTSSGNAIGWPIAPSAATGPRNWMSWAISTTQQWYCIASGANTSIQVCKTK